MLREASRSLRKIQLTWLGVGAWVGAILGACEVAGAADHTIDMFQASFLPQSAEIELGQSVEWVWRKGSHTVTSGLPNGAAGTPNEPGALFDQVVDEAHPSFTFTFGELREGGFPFFCKQHPEQIGFIQIATGEVSFRVAVVDNVFNPEEVVIFEGDTVRWEHEPMEDVHTVTSGRSSSAGDSPGELFDEELSDALPVFAYQFLSAGDYAYFCRPHEHMGMKGLVHVQEKFVRGDATGEGVVDISDAVAILGALFLGTTPRCCEDALDANDDGIINIGDPIFALQFLFLGGGRIPAPFPLPGGDRTEDSLSCCHGDV